MASRPGELHPGPLSEPYVRLSPHTAPIRRTRPQARPRFAAHTASSRCQLSGDAATRSDPFAPVPLQNLHRYYGSVRPSASLRYSSPLGFFATCASPLASKRLVPAVPHESLRQIHAPYTPVAACPVIRPPAGWSQEVKAPLVLTTVLWLTTRLRRVRFRSSL